MKSSLKIFLQDIKNISKNWVAALLIGGLIFMPSLYAWPNIIASWDPYGQTDQIPVAIVNEDKGATVRNEKIHVGDELVNNLKKNKSMDWQFVSREKAMDKLEYGDYYAVLIIPEDFSSKLGTVVSDHPEKAEVEYYVNEKLNAIAPKITDKGASVIVQSISSNFISMVNGIIFDIFNDLGITLEENLPDIEKFENYIFTLEKHLPEINKILNETVTDADKAEDLINQAKDMIPKVDETTKNGIEIIDNTTAFLKKAEDRYNEISPRINEGLNIIQSRLLTINEFMNDINTSVFDLSNSKQVSDRLNTQIDDMLTSIETIEDALNLLLSENDNGEIPVDEEKPTDDGTAIEGNPSQEGTETTDEGSVIEEGTTPTPGEVIDQNKEIIQETLNQLESMKQELLVLQEQINTIDSLIEEKQQQVDKLFTDLKASYETVNTQVNEFITEYKKTEPIVQEEVSRAKATLADAREILGEVQSTIPVVNEMLARTEKNLNRGTEMLDYVAGEFPYINVKVIELANKIRELEGKTDINEIIELLKNDPEAEESFFAEPVILNETKLFPISNYGTGMTPFYTILSVWVGGLLLISLLSTEVHHNEAFTGKQIYFGRLFTFMMVGLLQTLVVTMGNLFLLQVTVKEPFWFVFFGLLCSIIFIFIVYTLVSVFGDVGKALSIILLVLQVAGSGGTFPVVLLPEFFQVINPFLPFTYAIDLMREAVGGIVWTRVFRDIVVLSIYPTLAIIIGVVLKDAINKVTNPIREKAKKTGLFH